MGIRILTTLAIALGLTLGLFPGEAWAQAPDPLEAAATAQTAADTAFILFCTALVLLMTPGLAFFYGGFVRSLNVLNTLMMSFVLMLLVGVTWILWGYSLAFAPGTPFIGGLQWLFLNGVGLETTDYLLGSEPEAVVSYAATVPHQAFMMFQGMFAIITPALISGALVGRLKFKTYFWFVLLWSIFIYCPLAHMVWAKGGFIGLYGGFGALDFAGGTVVHISSGVSAIVAALVLGNRKSYPSGLTAPHNVPFIMLGAGLLWFGWFGFNAGSALASGGLATVAFVATNCGAAAAGLVWILMEWVLTGKPTAVGLATGLVAGLVGVTPAAGFVTPVAALLIGGITAFCCYYAIRIKNKMGIDDALDTFPVHGVGGTVGAILTGVFASTDVNEFGANGLLYGNPGQLLKQIAAVAIAYIIAGVGTFVLLKILHAIMGLRVSLEVETQGLDPTEHSEVGYGEQLTSDFSATTTGNPSH
ncbi:ammonium transporter [Phormidium tenue]|uniref:ammonium transporter n=1 Tax=Phormidium tenue TaxID=126344 RepID=UPI0009FEBF44|nr:ammonium transporter [Phormidium tenue]MBD2230705.1 ammonium transporter [Phormidium tenue FACHB-1052]